MVSIKLEIEKHDLGKDYLENKIGLLLYEDDIVLRASVCEVLRQLCKLVETDFIKTKYKQKGYKTPYGQIEGSKVELIKSINMKLKIGYQRDAMTHYDVEKFSEISKELGHRLLGTTYLQMHSRNRENEIKKQQNYMTIKKKHKKQRQFLKESTLEAHHSSVGGG